MIRFGTGPAPADEGAVEGAEGEAGVVEAAAPAGTVSRELFVRHARKDGRLVAVLRAFDHGHACSVEAEVYAAGASQMSRPGPYSFTDAHQASAFVTEAVAALMYLGCDIQAQ